MSASAREWNKPSAIFFEGVQRKEERGLFGCAFWMFVETSVGIIRENLGFIIMQNKIIRALLISTGLLMVPIVASLFVDGWLWTFFDYIFAWVMFSIVSLAFTFVASSANGIAYKVAGCLAVLTAFLLVWINAAVGIIGDGDLDSPNGMYFGVIATLIIGVVIARLHANGMSRALFATALAQAAVPVIALIIWPPPVISWAPGVVQVFALNSVFVMLWVGSALLFRHAARKHT
jgi:hypothetical protein